MKTILTTVLFCIAMVLVLTNFIIKDPGTIFISGDQGKSWTLADQGFPEEEMITDWTIHDNELVVSTTKHGIYTFNSGNHAWHPLSDGLPENETIDAIVSFKNSLIVSTKKNGMYMSSDAGKQWSPISSPGKTSVRDFLVWKNQIFAGTSDGIYVSGNAGLSWKPRLRNLQVNDFHIHHEKLFAATSLGVYRSDNGVNFEHVYSQAGVSQLASGENGVVGRNYSGKIFTADQEGNSWIPVVSLLENQYTFQITPTSSKILIESWMRRGNFLKTYQGFGVPRLPEKVPFSEMIPVQGGLLILGSVGKGGC